MGLIKAAMGALGGTLADSWKEAVCCPEIDNTIILKSGVLMNKNKKSSNAKGTPGLISRGSVIIVEENTCMLTIDNGKITNIVTEPGQYTFDNSTAPSVFAGDVSESIQDALDRFTFGGNASSKQKVIYVNLQPLPGITFGTGTPMPYPDPEYNTTLDLRFYGTFEIQIENAEMAVRFYREVASKGVGDDELSTADIFKSHQYKNEFIQSLMQALNMLSEQGVCFNKISSYLSNLTENVQRATENNWKKRGFKVTAVGISPITLTEESRELIKGRLMADTLRDENVQRAMMVGSVARGIENAGSNAGGASVGFMGMNMAMNAGGALFQQTAPKNSGWTCNCGTVNSGKFCAGCGRGQNGTAPSNQTPNSWTCSCGTVNTGKFCSDCGNSKPAVKSSKCNKCGFVPSNPAKPPKFCPECGDAFGEEDVL